MFHMTVLVPFTVDGRCPCSASCFTLFFGQVCSLFLNIPESGS